MQSFLVWWQYIPWSLSPVALYVGDVPLYWYALFFLLGSFLVYRLAGAWYIRSQVLTKELYSDFAFGVFVSALLGGKLGFLLVYWWPFVFSQELPLWPGQGSGTLSFPGMSFVGGFIAVAGFIYWYAQKHQKNFFTLTDILALYIPIAIFFGRLGNFVHGELRGRITEYPWGMYAHGELTLRHPSPLYAALLEGAVLFAFLLFIKKRVPYQGKGILTAWFCILYGTLRFISEFFREPDSQIGYIGMLTLNQLIAGIIFIIGVTLLTVKNRKIRVY